MVIPEKSAYVCGPLTDFDPALLEATKSLYVAIADLAKKVSGVRGFVPHEHCDPVHHATLTPKLVDGVERKQVCEFTSILIVVAVAPSWGGGIEVEMAFRSKVPIVILIPKGLKVSRLLLGNPGVKKVITYSDNRDALKQLKPVLEKHLKKRK